MFFVGHLQNYPKLVINYRGRYCIFSQFIPFCSSYYIVCFCVNVFQSGIINLSRMLLIISGKRAFSTSTTEKHQKPTHRACCLERHTQNWAAYPFKCILIFLLPLCISLCLETCIRNLPTTICPKTIPYKTCFE